VTNVGIYALHPIMYQVPIFATLEKRTQATPHLTSIVLFGDDLSLRDVFYDETKVIFKPDTPNLLTGYKHIFLRNYARDSRGGFWSRVNPGITREIRRRRISVLLIHGYENLTSWIAAITAKCLGVRIIWRGEAVARAHGRGWKQLLKKPLLSLFFRNCDAVLYSCSGNRKYLESFGISPERMFFIPCAVDNDFFRAEHAKLLPKRNELRAELGLTPEDFVVLFCARFTGRKRPADVVTALANLDHPRFVALFVGDGPERPRLEMQCSAQNVRAVFVGFKNQSEVSKYYTVADVALVVSEHDPSPKALNEAMNFALPVIATSVIGTAPDLVQDGETGYLVEVGDTAQISDRLRRLYENAALSKRMGAKGKEIVGAFNYERDVDGILQAIESVSHSSARQSI